MDIAALLTELYGRVPPVAMAAVDGLAPDDLVESPRPDTNSIAWLVWHLTRVQDHHVSELLDAPQLWVTEDWGPRFGVDSDPHNTGYGHSPEEVAAIRPDDGAVLLAYLRAVDARTQDYLGGLAEADLDRVVDRRWNPPVTLGVRLVSVADDCLQHAGQAAYARGLVG